MLELTNYEQISQYDASFSAVHLLSSLALEDQSNVAQERRFLLLRHRGANIVVPNGSLSSTDGKGLADVLSSVGGKWTIMVVGALSKGELRYNEIQRRVSGISQRMLTLTLKRLEADGIVTRTLFPSASRHEWVTS